MKAFTLFLTLLVYVTRNISSRFSEASASELLLNISSVLHVSYLQILQPHTGVFAVPMGYFLQNIKIGGGRFSWVTFPIRITHYSVVEY